MTLAVTAAHRDLAQQMRAWAGSLAGPAHVRAVEGDPGARFEDVWEQVVAQQVATIGLDESVGGGGGTLLDVAVVLESAAHAMVPGALLGTTFAALVAGEAPELAKAIAGGARVALEMGGVVLDGPGADWLLVPGEDHWYAVRAGAFRVEPAVGLDLSRRFGVAEADRQAADVVPLASLTDGLATRTLVALGAAEASGVARWCLDTAVEHARVREQFGQPIGRFQAIKQLCASMLERTEAVAAAAWDCAASVAGDPEQAGFAAEVAGTTCFDGAVSVAQDCIQVLGGMGFTFEHDAHLYLRRAIALRSLLGGSERHAKALAQRAQTGVRRRVDIELGERGEAIRQTTLRQVEGLVEHPPAEQRAVLAEQGLLQPHWPAPYGRGADALEQLAISAALAEAGVTLPDLKIGGWAIPTILEHGTDAQRERFVWPTLRGELSWCQLFSEPGAGSDLASLRTRAERVEGGWRLTGQKVWTSLAQQADWGICLARTDAGSEPGSSRHDGITYFLVDMSAPGIDIRPLREMTGDALFNEVFLDGVVVADDQVVGEVGGGWRLARTTLANERVAMAGTKLGVSTERAVSLLETSSGPADAVRVGRAVALATVCGLLDVRTTLRSLAGQGPGPESSVAKLLTVQSRQDASELVVDLHGPAALLDGEAVRADVHEMLLTRCLSIAGGTTQILRNVAAERILGLPR